MRFKFYKIPLAVCPVVMGVLMLFAGCKTRPAEVTDPFEGFDPYGPGLGKNIAAYNSMLYPNTADQKKGNPAIYIDFSAGINNAFKEPAISSLMTQCFNTVLAEKFSAFKLSNNTVAPMPVSNSTELGQLVSDPQAYLDVRAPIQAAVEQITSGDNDALLITDFEEWQDNKEITNAAYLKIAFSKWLAKGNSIHFFIADFQEGKSAKHIYFTVFNCGTPNGSSLISKLGQKLAILNARFDLSAHPYQLSTSYPGEKGSGIFYDHQGKTEKERNVLDIKDYYINGLKNGGPFEFYPLGLDWKTIAEVHDSYEAEHQFTGLFRNLYIDLSNRESYIISDFEARAYDVSSDFEQYARSREALAHHPKLAKGGNGESKFAPDESDQIALGCYNPDGSLKKEWVYNPVKPRSIEDAFILNQELFKNTLRTDKTKAEFGISFDPKFSFKNLTNPDGLIKIDIVLKTARPNLDNPMLDKFKWANVKGIENVGLYESIKTTLQELQPAGKAAYSYYIKTQQP